MLELIDISFSVTDPETGSKRNILKNINLTVKENTFMVITGPNGSGKSTLAKLIMGIEKPDQGRIILDGEDITALSVTERAASGIGFAFQQPVRFKGLLVRDLLNLASRREMDNQEACSYLAAVGLCANDYIDRELNSSLSGGELKRIEIAMLTARSPKVSIFDEPEAGIDLWSFQNLIKVFKKIRDSKRGAVLIISHQERILNIADTIAVLAGGKITGLGAKNEVLPGLLADSTPCRYLRQEEAV